MAAVLTPHSHTASQAPGRDAVSMLLSPLPAASVSLGEGRAYLHSASKRTLDLVVALGLAIALLPLLLFVAVLIKITSAGPVFFTQRRAGAFGRPFTVIKFRSMTNASCAEGNPMLKQATRNDARVTAVGRFLRRTSIDELPQLFNVLTGDMSLIGPRPHALCHDEYYGALIPEYSRRFDARPGLSGMAQVGGARGETPQLSDMRRRVDLDVKYIETASLQCDFAILCATAKEMLFSKQAF